jgi:L-threonylcarbamoyladenylate synthase
MLNKYLFQKIKQARQILRQGGVIIYPTDTLYGLGADIFNTWAIKKIFKIKGRDFKKPLSIIVSDFKEMGKLAQINKEQKKLINALLPGPFTFILKKKNIVSDIITGGMPNVGLRIPKSEICKALSQDLPIITTSANVSGSKTTTDIKIVSKIFKDKIDFILPGENLSGKASVIIDLTQKPFKINRY